MFTNLNVAFISSDNRQSTPHIRGHYFSTNTNYLKELLSSAFYFIIIFDIIHYKKLKLMIIKIINLQVLCCTSATIDLHPVRGHVVSRYMK
jgi:hypothetical protein